MMRQKVLRKFRERMKERGIDYYIVPTSDFHQSEYVGDYFKAREYLSGFSGSNGTLVIGEVWAGLWTDGRYFIQAEKELRGTGIELCRMQEEGVPTINEYLESNMKSGQTLGFDGRCISAASGKRYAKKLQGVSLSYEIDLVDAVWTERPSLSCGAITCLTENVTGKTAAEKIKQVREAIKAEEADGLLLTKLDEIMWLYNIRGCDVACNPVALSYGYISGEEAVLWVQRGTVDDECRLKLKEQGISLCKYEEILLDITNYVEGGKKVIVDEEQCHYTLYQTLNDKAKLINKKSLIEPLKAVKNPVELKCMEDVYLKDSLALTRFIKWLKEQVGEQEITEWSAGSYMRSLRSSIPEFQDDSFKTICAYKENAAMMHYEAHEEDCKVIEPEGMLLIDSGGQYLGGTTDVTRTIVLGDLEKEIKKQYTAVVCGMLKLSDAIFLEGCTGRNIDILARAPLWNMGIDYRCGTGHGIGYMLNVHEGPQNVRWRYTEDMKEAVLKPGMILSNEPGVYVAGSHGIRIENILAVKEKEKNEYGTFLHFQTLTLVPIDLQAIEPSYMTEYEIALLNQYHDRVYEALSPYLLPEEQHWLREQTSSIHS